MDDNPIPPPPPDNSDRLLRAVRSLTVAVWCVAVGIFLLVAMTLFSYARFYLWAKKPVALDSKSFPSTSSGTYSSYPQSQRFEGKDFNELPSEKQIKYASAILLTKWVKNPKGKTKAIVSEIVKNDGQARACSFLC